MSVKQLILRMCRLKEMPSEEIERLTLIFEEQIDEVLEAFNNLNFEKQCDFIEKIFNDFWPESYLIAAQFLARQDEIDEDVRYQLNEIASQKNEQRLAALTGLSHRLKNQQASLGEEVQAVTKSLQDPLALQKQIEEKKGQLIDLRKKRIKQSPELFALRDLEKQITDIQRALEQLQGYDFKKREGELKELQEAFLQKQQKQEQLDAATESLHKQIKQAEQEIENQEKTLAELQASEKEYAQQIKRQQNAIEQAKKQVAEVKKTLKEIEETAQREVEEARKRCEQIKEQVQVSQEELDQFKQKLENIRGFSSRLENLPASTPKNMQAEIEKIKVLLDEESENGLKKRIRRIYEQLEAVDEVEKILSVKES